MPEYRLNLTGKDLLVYRENAIILRGRFDSRIPQPRITKVPQGWRIEHAVSESVEDVFELSSAAHWFGGQELIHQLWPLERAMLDADPLITSDNGPQGLSCVLAPVWLASSGIAVLADHDQKHSVRWNHAPGRPTSTRWDLQDPPPFDIRPRLDDGTGDGLLRLSAAGLRYTLLAGDDLLGAWRACARHWGRPAVLPPRRLWEAPIWTTWARFKTDIDQGKVLDFADAIIAHGYSHGVMEIDDRWQTRYGDLTFDPARFPNPKKMTDELHRRGFAVTCWVMPFINPDAEIYPLARERGFLLQRADRSPLPVRWWQGDGFLIDIGKAEARQWFAGHLRALQAGADLDGFKFDAGEAIFAGGSNEYTHRYVDFISENFPLAEVRCGWDNQRAPLLFRQWDKSSTWGADNGLKSVITGALAIGLAGYPFILPDMVGGNAYREEKADAELMVRWTQASALFPAIQFSLAPWDFGEECDRLCRGALEIRRRYMDHLDGAMQAATVTGDPPIRPIWWLSPDDPNSQICDDEYLVGERLLVAPVLQPGQRARNVYLPQGSWRESHSGGIAEGPRWMVEVSAPLDELLVYERI
jgi:alpha-glucosidase (family GH31 glycosyl hydrolase)